MTWLYLALDALALSGPLLLSFDRRVAFYRSVRNVMLAIVSMMLVFVPLDMVFVRLGIWGFDARYITGIVLGNLPIEEWLFFPVVGYACLFIYECLRVYVTGDYLEFPKEPDTKLVALGKGGSVVFAAGARVALLVVALLGIALAISHTYRLYSLVKMGGAAVALLLTVLWFRPRYLPRFFLMYVLSCIPFIAMNGVMTGSLIEGEIVWYNAAHIVGFRIGTIPIEDFYYSLAMLLLATAAYEHLRGRHARA